MSGHVYDHLDPLTHARAARVKLMVFDIDGILTDGSLHYGPEGEALKTFNVQDGLGIKFLQSVGIATAIITARNSPIVARRAADLGIAHVQQGSHDKLTGFTRLAGELGLDFDECGFLGDDVVDLPVLKRVGFAVSVPNGRPEVQAIAHYVTKAHGGRGAAREVCDMILKAQEKFEAALAPYLV